MSSETENLETYTISDLSRIYGVTHRALRFYEKYGLLEPIREGKSRFYEREHIARLQIILKCKHLGFTLAEIADILNNDSNVVSGRNELKLDEKTLVSQIKHLEERRSELNKAIYELRDDYIRRFSANR